MPLELPWKSSYIIGSDAFPLFQLAVSYLICKLLAVVNMVDGFTNKGFENSCNSLATKYVTALILDRKGLNGISILCIFGSL